MKEEEKVKTFSRFAWYALLYLFYDMVQKYQYNQWKNDVFCLSKYTI